jgi:hypothetical protein
LNYRHFVRIGNTDDNIWLYRKDAGSIITKIIDGAKGILPANHNKMKIKVIRDATSGGYGTPGYKNSPYRLAEGVQEEIKVSPDIFSPDNDGTDDFATIDYHFRC